MHGDTGGRNRLSRFGGVTEGREQPPNVSSLEFDTLNLSRVLIVLILYCAGSNPTVSQAAIASSAILRGKRVP